MVATLIVGSGVRAAQAIGPNAMRSGFNQSSFAGNDDGSIAVTLPFPVAFYGQTYTSAYLNNNGNLTFGQPLRTYTPPPLSETGLPMIAPFFADVARARATSSPTGQARSTAGRHSA